jgi:hypothetical protein
MNNLQQVRRLISLVVYGLISLVIATIIVRIFLLIIGANTASPFVVFIYNTSATFVGMFQGIYPSIYVGDGKIVIEIYSVVALLFYVMLAYLISKSIRAVIDTDVVQIISNLIDSGFKFAEAVLIMRFIFKLTGASVSSQFVRALYEISNIIYEPFQGILPGFSIASLGVVFETSTLIAIIAIIIFDSVSEGIIKQLNKSTPSAPKAPAPQPVRSEPTFVHVQAPQPASQPVNPQHITINMPQQQPQYIPQQPQYVDRRTIQVIQPQQPLPPAQNYPYQGQNDLEHQRPIHNQQLPGQNVFYRPNTEHMAPRNASPGSVNT